MRQARHHKAFWGMRWRRAAPTLALLALLASQALLPVLHFAAGGPLVPVPATAPPDLPLAGHHHAGHGQDDGSESGGAEHQVCHFCRLAGVALPPPPTVVIALLSRSRIIEVAADQSLRPQEQLDSGHPARAPPPMA